MAKTRATHNGITYEISKDPNGAYWLHFLDFSRQAVHPSEEFEYLSHALARAHQVAKAALVWVGDSPLKGSEARVLELEQQVLALRQQMSSALTQISNLSGQLGAIAQRKDAV